MNEPGIYPRPHKAGVEAAWDASAWQGTLGCSETSTQGKQVNPACTRQAE